MDRKLYRETLFSRALEALTAQGGYAAAYLLSDAGLVWAKATAGDDEPNVSALAGAAAEFFARAEAAAFDDVRELTLTLAADRRVSFYRFRHAGETAVTFFLVLFSEGGGGDRDLVARVVAEIKEDLKEFY